MKKLITMTLVIAVFILSVSFTAYARNISVILDGKEVRMDVPPQIINGRTMVPIRAVTEAMGCEVKWDPHTKSIDVTYWYEGGYAAVLMWIDDKEVVAYSSSGGDEVEYETIYVDAPPVIVNGRTLVPLRLIAEAFGYDVWWNEGERTVYIINPNL